MRTEEDAVFNERMVAARKRVRGMDSIDHTDPSAKMQGWALPGNAWSALDAGLKMYYKDRREEGLECIADALVYLEQWREHHWNPLFELLSRPERE